MNTCDEWASIAAAERQVQRATDYDEIEDLQNAYGYYAEKSLWSDIAALFTDDGILEIDDARHAGHERIRDFPKESGPDGPVKGALNSLLQLQPVIHIAADGRTARIRFRLLQLTRDARGRAMWGSISLAADRRLHKEQPRCRYRSPAARALLLVRKWSIKSLACSREPDRAQRFRSSRWARWW